MRSTEMLITGLLVFLITSVLLMSCDSKATTVNAGVVDNGNASQLTLSTTAEYE